MIPFSPPHMNQEIIDEVIDTLKSGWITTGPKTKAFEKQLGKYCSVPSILCISSATFGLELILRWFGVQENDEVIIPAYTYTATANAVMHTGAKPIMVDCNSDDFNINISKIKAAITKKTKVIIPVDIAGFPSDYQEINNLVKNNQIIEMFRPNSDIQKKLGRILILADAAHSFGAKYKDCISGSLTDISIFSFHAVKNLTTAEGGAVALNLPEPFDNNEIYEYLNIFSLHGQNKDALAKSIKGNWRYDVIVPGYKGNMTDITASMGIIGLKYYNSVNLARRKEIFKAYQNVFSKFEWAETPVFKTNTKESSYHLYLLRIKGITEEMRDTIIEEIFNNDVSVNVHFQPLPTLTAYKNLGYDIKKYPTSFDNYKRLISLPVYQDLTEIQVKKIIEVVVNSVQKFIEKK